VRTSTGTREVSPFEGGWICLVTAVLYDEFISSPACNGDARCALTQTASYFAKHKQQLTPIQVIGQWLAVITLARWSTYAVEETFRMCADTPGCLDTQGIGACDGNWQCINGMAYDMQIEDEDYTIENEPYNPSDPLAGYYAMLGAGYYEWSLGSELGWNSVIAPGDTYDAQFGYGSWGELTEEVYGGEGQCQIVTPACP
jgi:hypothetical protein